MGAFNFRLQRDKTATVSAVIRQVYFTITSLNLFGLLSKDKFFCNDWGKDGEPLYLLINTIWLPVPWFVIISIITFM